MAYPTQQLNRFITVNKAFADVPFTTVEGVPITLREATIMLQLGEYVPEITYGLSTLGVQYLQEDWLLVEDYYRRLLQLPEPRPVFHSLKGSMTLKEALLHVRRRDPEGQKLLWTYHGLLREMARKMM